MVTRIPFVTLIRVLRIRPKNSFSSSLIWQRVLDESNDDE